ncbi:helicase [Tersicoccus solisilvae]|uniref:Helicase n=1 Tax=Tersicoccus solisilvae TaxID=1882339 RepID=A0ABQ1PAL7_9MICC|nr:type ISP restriction/modification enzyme [Tersicoccus solisilvae]GGC92361.1 helicase [Tersicoccus solisilvae]
MGSTTFESVLDRLYFTATSERDKGTKFERLVKRYLELEPKYADQFSDVWLWTEWPGRNGQVDTGIDLVAKDRYTGELTAIQAKFFDPARTLQKAQIDSFFTASGKVDFAYGMVVSTTDHWSKHAEDALENQSKQMSRLRLQDLADSTIDWSAFDVEQPEQMRKSPAKEPRKYQREAIADVVDGFAAQDRGKLIMACGTGKTFTSLKIVEEMVPVGGTVLFLVPSIALLQQTLNEWTAQAQVPLRPLAVCSDAKVGRKQNEDVSVHDLGFPATTDPQLLVNRARISTGENHVTVVFSTYQSIDVIAQAQQAGLPDFDLILCDEAHRTTGITEPGADDSAFTRVHDNTYLVGAKRLYMTATPRIYIQQSKAKAAAEDVAVYSMDDEATYGPELHHLGFGRAVEMGHLSDYKVLVLAVDEDAVSRSFQGLLADESHDLRLDDAARIVGCWSGLSKRGVNGERLDISDHSPMRRAVAFARNIKESKKLAEDFELIGTQLAVEDDAALRMEGAHVDGTFNVLERQAKLDWLKADTEGNRVRILSNARCLSEGVDVPTLDAVLFLNPRSSQVDVVQSVGRVMRKAEGKEYGYIILPIAVPASESPETALDDNKRYKVVWDVLQALRAHDDRFEAMVNKIDLDPAANRTVDVIGVGGSGAGQDGDDDGSSGAGDGAPGRGDQLSMFHLANADEWRNAIFARMVRKVGDRRYWEQWASDVKDIADRHTTRIRTILDGSEEARAQFAEFLAGLRGNLNDGITEANAIDMLSQHLITKPVFEALFADYSFAAHNPVSQVMDGMLAVLEGYHLGSEIAPLEDFYRSVRIRAEGIDSAAGKQKIITELYERFFKLAFPRVAESLGIVYTPTEVVDFIIRAVDDVLVEHFGTSLSGEGVHVLDPFTGTGTFIARLLQSGRIKPEDLLRKYTQELHANEILLLPYYIAAINIEATFHGLQGGAFIPFDGIVLTDTFQSSEHGDALDERVFTANNERVIAQNALDIRVIIGNPPYSVGQTSGNDNNANLKYPHLDASIRDTYEAGSAASLTKSLYDSYIRAFRWASDRILKSDDGGVVAYVSNGGYIDSNSADGLRKSLAEEFHHIFVYNLRGNQRTAGEQSRKEGGKIFDAGSRATVAVLILVKRPGVVDSCVLHYKDIGDYLDRRAKLDLVERASLATLDWQTLTPNRNGDWINQRNDEFRTYTPIGDKGSGQGIFATYSAGLKTNRDAWVYNDSEGALRETVGRLIANYNAELDRIGRAVSTVAQLRSDAVTDPTKINWDGTLEARFLRSERLTIDEASFRSGTYRPFNRRHVYANRQLNNSVYKLPSLYPDGGTENYGFYNVGNASAVPFSVVMTDLLPDLHVTGAGSGGQFFPRYTYVTDTSGDDLLTHDAPSSSGFRRVDNITDEALADYRAAYGADVTKDDLFFFVYGLLHSPEYRERFAADLKKMLPRIPQVPGVERFRAFADAGRALSELHIGYENVEPYPLTERETGLGLETDAYAKYAVTKMKYGGKSGAWDRTRVIYNGHLTVEGIPEDAHRYMLGSRSAVDWILERYQVKTDKASGIVNDPNDWSREHHQPRYIIDLLKRIVTVSVETNRIVDGLPDLGV